MTIMCIIIVPEQYNGIGLRADLAGGRECTQDDCTSATAQVQ